MAQLNIKKISPNNNKMNFTQLIYTPYKSILHNQTFEEHINEDLLNKLINSKLLKDTFNNPLCQAKYQNEKIQLIKYKELVKNGIAQVTYKQNEILNMGRVIPVKSLGLFSIRRELRHTLAKNNYVDIDIDNCHPVILSQLLKNNNISCKYLDDYIKNRQLWFNLIIKEYKLKDLYGEDEIKLKEVPKSLFISIMYGGGVNKWIERNNLDCSINTPKKLLSFINEIKRIMVKICDLNKELVKSIIEYKKQQGKKDYNIYGSVSSYFLQEKENIILEEVYKYLVSKYIIKKSVVLCADGLMIEKEKYYKGLLEELQQHIKNVFDIDLNFSKKEMKQNYTLEEIENNQYTREELIKKIPELDFKPDIVNNQKYLSYIYTNEIYKNNDTIILNSCCGTGKTYSVAKYIKENDDIVISIIPRISLAKAQIKQFREFNYELQNYQDKETLDLNKSYVMCVNSLVKLFDKEINYYENKVLYIDEISSFLENLTHSTIMRDNIKIIHNVLMKMVKYCKKVIVSDHTIYNNTFQLLHKRNKPIFIKNTYQKFKDVKSNRFIDENEFMEKMASDPNGFFACFDSATIAEQYYTYIAEKKNNCILITSQTDTPIPDDLTEWEGKRVFYSPRIEYGCDFNISTKQNVYCHMKGFSILPSGSFQQITRTRNMNELYFFSSSKPQEPKYKDLYSVDNKVMEFTEISKNYFNCCCFVDEDDEIQFTNNTFHKLFTFNEYLSDCFDTDKTTHLINILKNNGFIHNDITNGENDIINMKEETEKQISEKVKENKEVEFMEWVEETKENKILTNRAEFLNIQLKEDKEKHKDILTSQYNLEQHLNTIRLLKDKEFNEEKERINNSYIGFNFRNIYTKINALYLYETQAKINRFDFSKDYNENVEIDTNLWEGIKKMYRIRTKTKPTTYKDYYKTYLTMINNLSPKLIKSKKQNTKDKMNSFMTYLVNDEIIKKCVELDELKNPKRTHFNQWLLETLEIQVKEPFYLMDDDEED